MTSGDEDLDELGGAGWTMGDVALRGPSEVVWLVWGSNGENLIRAQGTTRDEAWGRTVA